MTRYCDSLKDFLPENSTLVIITDDTIAATLGKKVAAQLKNALFFSIAAGEGQKNRKTKEAIEDFLFKNGCGRETILVALGGGVVNDLTGFVAATFCRGIPWIAVPTTLLAMVDASIGGKVGINTPFGKNSLGAFHPPEKIVLDLDALITLPPKEMRNGMAEIIKHALIASVELFCYLENHRPLFEKKERAFLQKVIETSGDIKKSIVEKDPYEKGLRRILNFGHTMGHALELYSNYTLPHGEAVAWGMMAESYLSFRLGKIDSNTLERIRRLLFDYQFPLKQREPIKKEIFKSLLLFDKKAHQKRARFVLLERIGAVDPCDGAYCAPIEAALLEETLNSSLEWLN